ncbi:hypothetical protein CC77DRAFT_1086568 [Alternaria alternata]|uniref:Chitin-binding type-1 domain-containing protein n=1 Tax=Alternaria alternata TaxID=5599 RepID=A0A177DXL6_ALTAL|nr:hypothetical protein CC77DRAFT_1086568 [Alternaria alternata]OAG23529.1 hypothetical protein CC77DRAFT_1086568 [Alternaria alternata]
MQPCLFLLAASAAGVVALASSEISILLPTTTPSGPQDPWECTLSAYTPFFNPPLPTGAVKSALDSYGDGLIADCTGLECPYPDVTRWCGITTAAPTAVLPAYTSYASSASVWALTKKPTAGTWLNLIIANAECFGKAPEDDASSIGTSSIQPSLTSSPRSSSAFVSSPTSTTSSSAGIALSPNGQCGGLSGYHCPGSGFGDCCSSYGWCGNDSHCDAGCQLGFGFCNVPTKISPDGSCGTVNSDDGFIYPGSGFGDCCMNPLLPQSSLRQPPGKKFS